MSSEAANFYSLGIDCWTLIFFKLNKVDLSTLSEVDRLISATAKDNLFWKPRGEDAEEKRNYREEKLREAKGYNGYFFINFNLRIGKGNAFAIKKRIKKTLNADNLKLDPKVQIAIITKAPFQEIRWLLKLGARVKPRHITVAIDNKAPADVVKLMQKNIDSVEVLVKDGPAIFYEDTIEGAMYEHNDLSLSKSRISLN